MSKQAESSDFDNGGKIRIYYLGTHDLGTNVVTEMSIENLYQNFKQRLIKEVNETPSHFIPVSPVKRGPDA